MSGRQCRHLRLAHGDIGTALVPVELTYRLLLCSDGVGKQWNSATIELDLVAADHAAEATDWAGRDAAGVDVHDADVDGAEALRGHSDNITAVVIDLTQQYTGRHW